MYKVTIVDRNGRVSKHMPKVKPEIKDGQILVYNTDTYILGFVIANLTSYSIIDIDKRAEKRNDEDAKE